VTEFEQEWLARHEFWDVESRGRTYLLSKPLKHERIARIALLGCLKWSKSSRVVSRRELDEANTVTLHLRSQGQGAQSSSDEIPGSGSSRTADHTS
jgi:hypothetical protein